MAKVKGPLFSLSASGTYEGLITFRPVGNGTSAGRPPRSRQPRSQSQLDNAANIANMSASWSGLDAGVRAAWNACAVTLGFRSGYNLFWAQWLIQGSAPGNPPVSPCA